MTTVSPSDASTAAAIPHERRGIRRLRTLTDAERLFYRGILRSFRAGAPPSSRGLADAAFELGLEVAPTLERLARDDLVHHDSEGGAILVAYPFSGRATAHRVRFAGGTEVFAMCAIDALGTAPMFGEPIEIASRDPRTGEQIRVELEPDGHGSWQPEEAVVVCGTAGGAESCSGCCPVLNFFASAKNAKSWLASRPDVRGGVLSMDEAIAAGRTAFGDILEQS